MTRLFFIDESRDRSHHYHVGILADGPGAAAAEAALNGVVHAAYDMGITRWGSELHAVPIFHGTGDWARGAPPLRAGVFTDALAVLAACQLEVIARGVNLSRFARRYQGDPFRWEFSNLLERVNERLRAVNEYGLVIADQQNQHRKLLQSDVANGKAFGTGGYRNQRLTRVLDTAHFVDSRLSRLVQLADVVAFVLRRRATIPLEPDQRAEAFMADWIRTISAAIPTPIGKYHTIR